MSLFLLTALFATVQAAVITLHPNGDTSYCLDGRNTPGNGHNGPIITHTFPCEKTNGYPIPSQVFDWRGTEIRLDETDPPRCLRSISGLLSLGDCAIATWFYDDAYQVIRYASPRGTLCIDPFKLGGPVHMSDCQLCPSVMNWTITEL